MKDSRVFVATQQPDLFEVEDGTSEYLETVRPIGLLRKFDQFGFSGSENFSNFARLLNLLSCFAKLLVP